jgi:hypothetical protein
MGIFAQDIVNNAAEANIGLYNDTYISVNTLYGGPDFVNNCNKNRVEMAGYTDPIKIDNAKGKIVTGRNELWIAVADGYDVTDAVDMMGPSWLFVRRNSLVCTDKRGRSSGSNNNARTGFRRCAQNALDSCGGVNTQVCRDWGCLDQYIQSECLYPNTARTDRRRYKQNVRDAIRSECRQ